MTHSDGGKGDSTRPTDHEAFSGNFDRIFSGKPQRGSFVQCPVTGKLIDKSEFVAPDVNAPMVLNDIQGYKSMQTGEWIGSRSSHREHLKQHRLVEIGTEVKHHLKPRQTQVDTASIRRDIINAVKRFS